MSKPTIQLDSVDIVLIGAFNPAILHPSWLKANGLIDEDEADAAKVKIVHPEIAQIDLDWAHLQVRPNDFVAQSMHVNRLPELRDITLGVFRILDQTPIVAMGVNRKTHFTLRDTSRWSEVAKSLAPLGHWPNVLRGGQLESIRVATKEHCGPFDLLTVIVEPSQRFPGGAYVRTNYHVDVVERSRWQDAPMPHDPEAIERVMHILAEDFRSLAGDSLALAHDVLQIADDSVGD